MKYTILVAVTALVAGTATTAHAKNATPSAAQNAASLKSLLTEWDQAGFNPLASPLNTASMGGMGM